MIAEFYLVDRGLRHRLPGFSSLNRRLSLRRVSAGSGANGHTAVVALRGRTPGERGWFDRNCPHRARSLLGDHKLEEPSRDLPSGLGIDPRDRMPTTTSSKSIRGSFTIAKSRSFCRPRPNPIWVPKHCSQDAPWKGLPWAIQGVTPVRDHWMPSG